MQIAHRRSTIQWLILLWATVRIAAIISKAKIEQGMTVPIVQFGRNNIIPGSCKQKQRVKSALPRVKGQLRVLTAWVDYRTEKGILREPCV